MTIYQSIVPIIILIMTTTTTTTTTNEARVGSTPLGLTTTGKAGHRPPSVATADSVRGRQPSVATALGAATSSHCKSSVSLTGGNVSSLTTASTLSTTSLVKTVYDEDVKKIHRHVYVTPSLHASTALHGSLGPQMMTTTTSAAAAATASSARVTGPKGPPPEPLRGSGRPLSRAALGLPTPLRVASEVVHNNRHAYRCMYCTLSIGNSGGCDPIGCPIRMVDHKAIGAETEDKQHQHRGPPSDGSTPTTTPTTTTSSNVAKKNFDKILSTEFITEGVFCSFNCAKAFANDRPNDPKYKNSSRLLAFMLSYSKHGCFSEPVKIIPSPSPYLMTCYGGILSESEYVDSIGKISYEDKGNISMFPVTTVFTRVDEI